MNSQALAKTPHLFPLTIVTAGVNAQFERSSQMENRDVEPAVERSYEDPPKPDQRAWNLGMTTIIVAVAAIFVIAILIYMLTR